MYVCMMSSNVAEYGSNEYDRQSYSWSAEQWKLIFPCPRSRLKIWSRDTCSTVPSGSAACSFSTLRLNLVLTHMIPPAAASIYLFKPPYAIVSVPSLSGHAIAYRWRSLPRIRRHRTSKPQGSSKRVLPWQITMDQLICASLSHTHY